MPRGKLTPEVKAMARTRLHDQDFNQFKLRLLPYIQYCLMNNQSLDINKLSSKERHVLRQWKDEGHIGDSPITNLTVTRNFWDAMNDILWFSYVDYE
jgi:hypothetical protein